MTKYIKNEFGGVHSVDDETPLDSEGRTAFDRLHEVTPNGMKHLPAGWSEITIAEAKKGNPQLFGAADPTVRMNAVELKNARALNEVLANPYDDSKE